MSPSEQYVADLISELKRLKSAEALVIDKLVTHFQRKDKGLHERYMDLDTRLARLEDWQSSHYWEVQQQ